MRYCRAACQNRDSEISRLDTENDSSYNFGSFISTSEAMRMDGMIVPYVPAKRSEGKELRTYQDIFSYLLLDKKHTIILPPIIDKMVAHVVISQLLYLDCECLEDNIFLYINANGASYPDVFAIYDAMRFVRNEVYMVCYGESLGYPTILLAGAGPKDKHAKRRHRFALPHARIMLPPILRSSDIGLKATSNKDGTELERMRNLIAKTLAEDTGQPAEKIHEDMSHNLVMDAQAAREYGIIDQIITEHPR